MRMFVKMLESEQMNYQIYTMYDFYKLNNFFEKLNSNKYIRFISDPIRILAYVMSIRKLINKNDEVVFYLYPTTRVLLDYLLILYLKLIKKEKIFLEVNEVRRYGGEVNKYGFEYYKYVAHERLSKYFDGLVCISKNIENYYKVYNKNTINIPILSNSDLPYVNNCTYGYNNYRPFLIGFTGSVHMGKENLLVFFEGIKKLVNKGFSIKVNLFGEIYNKEKILKIVNNNGLEEVIKYHGCVDKKNIPYILTQQDLLVLPRAETKQNKYGFSTKLSEYLTSGVPVLITDVSDNLEYLKPNKDCLLSDYSS